MNRTGRVIIVYVALIVYACAPLLSAWVASLIASAAGCRLHEGAAHPCIILGHDFGDVVYAMFVVFWAALVTLPTGALAILGYTAFLLVRKNRKKPNNFPQPAPADGRG